VACDVVCGVCGWFVEVKRIGNRIGERGPGSRFVACSLGGFPGFVVDGTGKRYPAKEVVLVEHLDAEAEVLRQEVDRLEQEIEEPMEFSSESAFAAQSEEP
jgi:hypothetical protein